MKKSIRRMAFLLALVLAMLMAVPALADQEILLPGGRVLELQPVMVGRQVRGEDAENEEIYRLDIKEKAGGELFQTLYFTISGWWDNDTDRPFIQVQDLNFDGFPDLDILYSMGASNSQHVLFFFDQETGNFQPWELFGASLSNLELLPEKQLLINYIHESALCGTTEIYRWEGKQLRCLRRAVAQTDWEQDTILIFSVQAQGDGEMEDIFRKELDLNTASDEEIRAASAEMDELLWEGIE